MKKILAVIILVLCVVSCAPMDESNIQESKSEVIYVRLKNSEETTTGHKQIQVVEFTYNDHQYLWFRDSNSQSAVGGPMHDPDCKKCLSSCLK